MDNLDKIFEQDRKEDYMDNLLIDSTLDMSIELTAPDGCVMIRQGNDLQRMFTLGNFSTISGKQKSKKTFLISMLMAAASAGARRGEQFAGMIEGKRCIYFDTEQSRYDSWKLGKIMRKSGANMDNIMIVSLRSFSPKDRLSLIEYTIKKYDDIGYVVIDGVSDLVHSINDELEAVDITTRFLRWTTEYNIHISLVIHQRKADTYARGHIGTAIMNKSEAHISATKVDDRPSCSIIKCEDMRGAPSFNSMELEIIDGIPYLRDETTFVKQEEHRPF